jgi:hypothetical protein
MATPTDLYDPSALLTEGGLVDAATATGQVDETNDWCGAVAAMLTVTLMREERAVERSARAVRSAPLRRGADWRYSRLRRARGPADEPVPAEVR